MNEMLNTVLKKLTNIVDGVLNPLFGFVQDLSPGFKLSTGLVLVILVAAYFFL